MYNNFELRELSLKLKSSQELLQKFLSENQLKYETLDYFVGLFDGEEMLAGGGTYKNVIKCIAVNPTSRDMQLTNQLISHLRRVVEDRGYRNTFIFTKSKNEKIFKSLAFYTVGKSDNSVLLESARYGIANYCDTLRTYKGDKKNGAIIVNCNPFTLGHRYLIETAAKKVDTLHVFVVSEEMSMFSFRDRLKLVAQGVADLPNVIVHQGSQYIISAATFPAYFLKDPDTVALNQIQLDLDIFARNIAPALDISIRFVGDEKEDRVTALYNETMKSMLPQKYGIAVQEIARKKYNGRPISATEVRKLFVLGDVENIKPLVPSTTFAFILAHKDKYVK